MRLILREANHSAHPVVVPDTMPPELRLPAGQEIRAGIQFFGEDFSAPGRRFLLQRRATLHGHVFQYEEA